MNAPPLPPRPSSSATPATPPPAPAPTAPIRGLEDLFRELVAALAPLSIPAPPATPASAPPSSSDAIAASLLPINQKQLEILQRAEAERANRVANEARDREWRRTMHYAVAALVVALEIASQVLRAYLATHYPDPTPPPATTVYVSPPPPPATASSNPSPPGAPR